MKLFLRVLAIFIIAFSCSIIPAILALVFWNSLWLLFYLPIIGFAFYLAFYLKDTELKDPDVNEDKPSGA